MKSETEVRRTSVLNLFVRRESWTVSNVLSLLRLLLAAPIVLLLLRAGEGDRTLPLIVMLAAGLTDFLDGILARAMDQITELGRVLDPLADKIAIAAVGFTLIVLGDLPLWFLLVVVVRDIVILAGGLLIKKRTGVVLPSNWAGKVAVTFVALVMLLAATHLDGLMHLRDGAIWVSVFFLTLSLVLYARRFYEAFISRVTEAV